MGMLVPTGEPCWSIAFASRSVDFAFAYWKTCTCSPSTVIIRPGTEKNGCEILPPRPILLPPALSLFIKSLTFFTGRSSYDEISGSCDPASTRKGSADARIANEVAKRINVTRRRRQILDLHLFTSTILSVLAALPDSNYKVPEESFDYIVSNRNPVSLKFSNELISIEPIL